MTEVKEGPMGRVMVIRIADNSANDAWIEQAVQRLRKHGLTKTVIISLVGDADVTFIDRHTAEQLCAALSDHLANPDWEGGEFTVLPDDFDWGAFTPMPEAAE